MLAQIPRKPTFPEHVIHKVLTQIQQDVENETIPVSAGIYSEYKLNQKLEAIPKPIIVDYEDPIFYDLAQIQKMPCRNHSCPLCDQQYNSRQRKAIQCRFCGVWNCSQCICPRKRYHPRAKDSDSERFDICYRCDDKFLSLTLNNSYYERFNLLQEVKKKIKEQSDCIAEELDKAEETDDTIKEDAEKKKFKISALKKENLDCRKKISEIQKETAKLKVNIEGRQNYIKLLKEKKEKNQQRLNSKSKDKVVPQKTVKRQLSQRKVMEEVVHQSPQKSNESRGEEKTRVSKMTKEIKVKEETQSSTLLIRDNRVNFPQNTQEISKLIEMNLKDKTQTDDGTNWEQPYSSISLSHSPKNQKEKQYRQKRLAEIFKKGQNQNQGDEEQIQESAQESRALEQIKRDLVRAAIQMSQTQRLMEEPTDHQVQKCTCHIY